MNGCAPSLALIVRLKATRKWAITLLGTVYPVFTTNSLSHLMEALVQLNSLVSPLLYSYRDRKIRKAVLELLGMKKPHASQLVAQRFVKANE